MKNRIVLGIIALLSMSLAAPAPLPEGPFYSYLPLMNRIVPATCPTLTVVEMTSFQEHWAPCSNYARIQYEPPGSCVETVQVFDADTGWEMPSDWAFSTIMSDHEVWAWFVLSNPQITEQTWFNQRFVAHFADGCVSEVTAGFYAYPPQAYWCSEDLVPNCPAP